MDYLGLVLGAVLLIVLEVRFRRRSHQVWAGHSPESQDLIRALERAEAERKRRSRNSKESRGRSAASERVQTIPRRDT